MKLLSKEILNESEVVLTVEHSYVFGLLKIEKKYFGFIANPSMPIWEYATLPKKRESKREGLVGVRVS